MGLGKFLKGFVNAFNGLNSASVERNFRVQFVIGIIVILAGFLLKITNIEFLILILTISIVLAAETFNTAIENICDIVRDKMNLDYEATRLARDISAGAVLILSFGAAVIGIIIFFPKIF